MRAPQLNVAMLSLAFIAMLTFSGKDVDAAARPGPVDGALRAFGLTRKLKQSDPTPGAGISRINDVSIRDSVEQTPGEMYAQALAGCRGENPFRAVAVVW